MTQSNWSKRAWVGAFVALFGSTVASCSLDGRSTGADGDLGATQLSIVLSSGVAVTRVGYQVSGNGLDPIVGSVDVARDAATASVLISGIPVGMGYVVRLNAITTDGLTTCSGQESFAISASETTPLTVVLACTGPGSGGGAITVNGRLNNCPVIGLFSVSPLQTRAPGEISVGATATDIDGEPLTYSWSASPPSLGPFLAPTAAMTTFRCDSLVTGTLTLTVSDGSCQTSESAPVNCGRLPACPASCVRTNDACEAPGMMCFYSNAPQCYSYDFVSALCRCVRNPVPGGPLNIWTCLL